MKTAEYYTQKCECLEDCVASIDDVHELIRDAQHGVIASLGFTNAAPGPHGLPDPFPGVPLDQLEQKQFPADYIRVDPRLTHDEVPVAAVETLNKALAGQIDTDIRLHWTNFPDNETNPLGEKGRFFIRLTRMKKTPLPEDPGDDSLVNVRRLRTELSEATRQRGELLSALKLLRDTFSKCNSPAQGGPDPFTFIYQAEFAAADKAISCATPPKS